MGSLLLRDFPREETRLSCFERSLLPDRSKILTGLLYGPLANIAHQIVDVVLHRLFAQGRADRESGSGLQP